MTTDEELLALALKVVQQDPELNAQFQNHLTAIKGDGTFEQEANKCQDDKVYQTISDQLRREGYVPTQERIEQRVQRIHQEIAYRNLVKNWTGK